ncbi:nuclear factor 7, brain-like [Protopterus annectens]|uniref:nuclear factor 7, brain-like n=1 Tax=Protopterus annectens TaxID=7888 RepID=UPI001CFA8D4F|nr:nuclear factor 7, brain-like [Protopterus annectens]
MGTSCANTYANLMVYHWEKEHLFPHEMYKKIIAYKRFVDDILIVWEGTRVEFESFLDYLETTSNFLSFTMEASHTEINFLDVNLSIRAGKLQGSLFTDRTLQNFSSVSTASRAIHEKEQLKKSLKNLSHKRDQQNSIIENFEAQLNAIPEKTRAVEEQIKKSFGKLHVFLYEEENSLLRKLHEDEEQLRQILEQRIQIIKNDLQLLTTGVDEIEKNIEEEDEISFLMKLKEMQERTNIPSKDVDLSPVALSDDPYAGPLQYWIWRKMLNILKLTPEPVKLNPETACPFLILDGQTRVRCGDKKRSVPDLPERFDPAACVLGNTGFDSGRYYWEVDVGIKTEWGLGVAKDSVTRKGEVKLSPSNGFWAIVRDGEVYGAYTVPPTPLKLTKQPRRIGVYLDCEKGLLSFYDPYEFCCIYTYKDTFVEKVYPFFFTGVKMGKGLPLQIVTPRL